MAWVYLRHPETGGACRVPDEPGVVESLEARGWQRHVMPAELDPDAPNSGVVAQAAGVYEPERILTDDEVAELKGKALDDALDAAGLSKSGTADEKRARLAEYEAGLADNNDDEGTE